MTEHIAFLGTGSMNGSIAAGLIAGGYPAEAIRATVRSKNSIDRLRHQLGTKGRDAVVIGCELKPEANCEAVSGASVVLLGVKPYGIVDLAREISPALAPDALVISVAAGVTLDTLQKALPAGQPVIRCMPVRLRGACAQGADPSSVYGRVWGARRMPVAEACTRTPTVHHKNN